MLRYQPPLYAETFCRSRAHKGALVHSVCIRRSGWHGAGPREPDAYEDPEISIIVDAVQEAVKPKSTLGRVKPNKLKVTNSQLRNAIVKALGGNNELPKDRKEQKALIDAIAKVYISRRIEEVSE